MKPTEETMTDSFAKWNGKLSDCKTEEDRNQWYSAFGAYTLGWQDCERHLTTRGTDRAIAPEKTRELHKSGYYKDVLSR